MVSLLKAPNRNTDSYFFLVKTQTATTTFKIRLFQQSYTKPFLQRVGLQ